MLAQLVTVALGPREFGNDNMRRVASEILSSSAPAAGETLIVEIREHAGWWLRFARIDGELEIIGTANDMACFPERIRQWRKQITEVNYLPMIERA